MVINKQLENEIQLNLNKFLKLNKNTLITDSLQKLEQLNIRLQIIKYESNPKLAIINFFKGNKIINTINILV